MEIVVTGEQFQPNESILVMSNHPSEADWLFFWSFANRWINAGRVRIVLKDIIGKAPGAGWVIENVDYLFLSRNWQKDKAKIYFTCNQLLQSSSKLLLFLFPEGTDFTPAKLQRSIKWANDNNIPYAYRHVLVPRTTGFQACLDVLRPKIDYVYDLTYAYENDVTPSFWTAWTGWFPQKLHVNIRKFPISDLPTDKKELAEWCYKTYVEKDEMIYQFKKLGHFPCDKKPQWGEPSNVVFWGIFWIFLTFLLNYLFWTSYWFRMYQYVGWTFYVLSSFSPLLRRLRSLDPPLNYLEKIGKKDN